MKFLVSCLVPYAPEEKQFSEGFFLFIHLCCYDKLTLASLAAHKIIESVLPRSLIDGTIHQIFPPPSMDDLYEPHKSDFDFNSYLSGIGANILVKTVGIVPRSAFVPFGSMCISLTIPPKAKDSNQRPLKSAALYHLHMMNKLSPKDKCEVRLVHTYDKTAVYRFISKQISHQKMIIPWEEKEFDIDEFEADLKQLCVLS